MKNFNLSAFLFNLAFSVILLVLYSYWNNSHVYKVGRFTRVELLDSRGAVRASLKMGSIGGAEVPQLELGGEGSRPAILLTTNEKDEGTMIFSSRDREGKVMIGYLLGSDVVGKNGQYLTDGGDSTSSWGLNVYGSEGHSTTVGVSNSGRIIEPLRGTIK